MENEKITKSIIYGNTYQNGYGKFLPICSSISDRGSKAHESSIEHILQYLKETSHFKKYNRVAYAYRVEEMPVVFITEKKNQQAHYYEGCHSDETIEGSGEKLLHLLEKFNIQNVLVAVLIQQFNPLFPFNCTNYRVIVENSRLLLDELYKKVIMYQEQIINKNNNDLLFTNDKAVKINKLDLGSNLNSLPNPTNPKPPQRPNHIYANKTKPQFTEAKPALNPYSHELSFLWQRCKKMKEQFESIIQSLEQKELEQMKYFVMYDKNHLINIVIDMFLIYENLTKHQLLNDYDFAQIKSYTCDCLEKGKLKKLDTQLKSNRKLNVDTILKINRGMGMLFSIMELKIRYSKTVDRIEGLLKKSNQSNIQKQPYKSHKVVSIDPISE